MKTKTLAYAVIFCAGFTLGAESCSSSTPSGGTNLDERREAIAEDRRARERAPGNGQPPTTNTRDNQAYDDCLLEQEQLHGGTVGWTAGDTLRACAEFKD